MNNEARVGYKSPPVATRFKKGQSGNPSGRRRQKLGFLDEAADVLNTPVVVRTETSRKSISAAKAMFRRTAKRAIAGDARAMRRIIELSLQLSFETKAGDEAEIAKRDEIILNAAKILKLDPASLLEAGKNAPTQAEVDERWRRDPRVRKKAAELQKKYAR